MVSPVSQDTIYIVRRFLISKFYSIGNGFAISVSYVLKIAVGIAYTQYLWMAMRNNSLALSTINNAFSIQNDPFSFLDLELIKKMWLSIIMATVFW